ncbi:MAG: O-antigen ligase family protein [Candidatus Cloacimonadaceae bacterium]|jgi:O-antigen ligase|nr:O-antigen ligase family protein [Candidatus Cloacimonadota bacterium]MCB5258296.1 O-antigen ligase family protein [Candidatus Cloacimonadota bacterium]MDD5624600.1 O-antigen ligase family protein [Candidatus Cloacimonadota bacterium]MDY0111482.1 O-antigen ligase family protein [Candidatus Syntrophosphaera sp.]
MNILKLVAEKSIYLLAALAVLAVAISLQYLQIEQIGLIGLAFLVWLVISLIFGFSVKNSLLLCSLFFIKPLPKIFYCVLIILFISLIFEYQHSHSLVIPYPVALIILLITSCYGLMRAREFYYSTQYFAATAIVPLLLFILIGNTRVKKEDFVLWTKSIVIIGILLSINGLFMALSHPEQRLGSLWITAMTINGFYILSFFFSIALGIDDKSKYKYLWFTGAIVILLGMFYTYTRMALLAVLFGLILIIIMVKKMRYVGMLILLLIPLIIPSSMASRINVGLTFDLSIILRFIAWYYAIKQIKLVPWFGMGIDVWKQWYAAIVPLDFLYVVHPHNLFLKIWIELGIFGFLSYFYIIGATIRKYYLQLVKRQNDDFNTIIFIGVLALLFACLTDIFIQQFSVSLVFWITLAFMYRLAKNKAQSEEQ